MSNISSNVLRQEIKGILKTADLTVISAKKVREQIETKLNCSLLSRKKEIDNIVMELINQQQEKGSDGSEQDASSVASDNDAADIAGHAVNNDNDDNDEDNDNDDDEDDDNDNGSSDEDYAKKHKGGGKKRVQTTQRKNAPKKKKRKSINAQDTGSESDAGSDSDYEIPKKQPQVKKNTGGTGTGRKGTGFTRAYNLSPELSALMGADSLPRHEVVKKVWAIIKERNLYDPKNKQFAICDDQLLTIMKVKRFRTFGMLKHLKPHFLN